MLNKLRGKLGSVGLLVMGLLLVILLIAFGQTEMLSLGAVVALVLTAILGSVLVAVATKDKKDKLLSYVTIFLTVMVFSIIVGWLLGLVLPLLGF